MSVMHLRGIDFYVDRPFHVASVDSARLRAGVGAHDHDFYEVMYVRQGSFHHVMPERTQLCRAGEMVFVRPADIHSVRFRPGIAALLVNVAFRADVWRSYCRVVVLDPDRPWRSEGSGPLTYSAPSERLGAVAEAFDTVRQAYIAHPTPVDLCLFWSTLLAQTGASAPPDTSGGSGETAPAWLSAACRSLNTPEHLQVGTPRLAELAGVSGGYLVRTMRRTMGMTPTEYVTERRLQRAAGLLASSNAAIAEIALDCGYENLSYFYRCFRSRFGTTPRAYRAEHNRAIVA